MTNKSALGQKSSAGYSRRHFFQVAGLGVAALGCLALGLRSSSEEGAGPHRFTSKSDGSGSGRSNPPAAAAQAPPRVESPGFTTKDIVLAHFIGLMAERPIAWQNAQIRQVLAGGHMSSDLSGAVERIDGDECLVGNRFNFKVREEFAFDIDEDVVLELEFRSGGEPLLVDVLYDKGDAACGYCHVPLMATPDPQWRTARVSLKRARFAGIGIFGTDFSLAAPPGRQITLRKINIHRSYTTPIANAFGQVEIETIGLDGKPTPVRMGVYDSSARLPYPSDQAVAIKRFNHLTRLLTLRQGGECWPVSNRTVFYSDGRYAARLPVGQYILVASKGPEYRIVHCPFRVDADRTTTLRISLARWIDMPALGWYSGEDHIHYARNSEHDNVNLFVVTRAEDLHIANILQMGNVGNIHFRQYDWRPVIHEDHSSFVLAPGLEDPRTTRRGHTISLHVKTPVRDVERYLLYHEVFEKIRAQNGLVGYAHVMDRLDETTLEGVGNRRGLALDMPFGLVDFVEVLQMGTGNTRTWFDFLNLGYKLVPTAGTDYPYIDLPGAVRSYVRVAPPFTPGAWFDGLRRGETFVSNGPMLEFSVNGKPMGSELHLRRGDCVEIIASATLNPDIDQLRALELIAHGEVIHHCSDVDSNNSIRLHYTLTALTGLWLVVRARGQKSDETASVVALSAPVYVQVGDSGFWKPDAVPRIVAELKHDLSQLLIPESEAMEPVEAWETQAPGLRFWDAQYPELERRVRQATALYDELIERARGAKESL